MTSAVVPIRGMRRLRMTGTRTVGAGTTVEPPVGGRGVKPAAGEAAFVATAAAPAGAAPTARGAGGRGAGCRERRSRPPRRRRRAAASRPRRLGRALRRDARGGGGGSTFWVSSETIGGGAVVRRSRPAPRLLTRQRSIPRRRSQSRRPPRPARRAPAPSPSALGAANAASYSATDENTGSPADAARARVAGSDATIERRRLLTIASRDNSRKFIREVLIRDPYGITSATFVASEPRILAAAEVISSSTSR